MTKVVLESMKEVADYGALERLASADELDSWATKELEERFIVYGTVIVTTGGVILQAFKQGGTATAREIWFGTDHSPPPGARAVLKLAPSAIHTGEGSGLSHVFMRIIGQRFVARTEEGYSQGVMEYAFLSALASSRGEKSIASVSLAVEVAGQIVGEPIGV